MRKIFNVISRRIEGRSTNNIEDLIRTLSPAKPPPPKFEPNVPTHEDIYVGGKVRLRLITIRLPQDRSRKALAKAKRKAKKIADELMNGADFAALAKKYSQGPLASKGGDLGFMAYKDMRPEWQKMVQRMKKGQVLGPVASQEAILLFYLADARGRTTKKIRIPERIRQKIIKQQREVFERQIQARERNAQRQTEARESSASRSRSVAKSAATDKKNDKASTILTPEEEEEYQRVRDKVLAIVKTKKTTARMKEWIEELRKNSIIDVKL